MIESSLELDINSLPGMLIIGSAPSGAGKNTIFSEVLKKQGGAVVESVSCTTRLPRPGEMEGKDYYFISYEQFEAWEREGYFLEAEGGHDERRYGTPLKPVLEKLRQGIDVLLVIEVEGARVARERVPGAMTIFIMPAGDTLDEQLLQLESQLRGRGTDSEEKIQRRLHIAVHEMAQAQYYQHVVVNAPNQLRRAVEEVNEVINAARRAHRSALGMSATTS